MAVDVEVVAVSGTVLLALRLADIISLLLALSFLYSDKLQFESWGGGRVIAKLRMRRVGASESMIHALCGFPRAPARSILTAATEGGFLSRAVDRARAEGKTGPH